MIWKLRFRQLVRTGCSRGDIRDSDGTIGVGDNERASGTRRPIHFAKLRRCAKNRSVHERKKLCAAYTELQYYDKVNAGDEQRRWGAYGG
jgi:hypothetical protein